MKWLRLSPVLALLFLLFLPATTAQVGSLIHLEDPVGDPVMWPQSPPAGEELGRDAADVVAFQMHSEPGGDTFATSWTVNDLDESFYNITEPEATCCAWSLNYYAKVEAPQPYGDYRIQSWCCRDGQWEATLLRPEGGEHLLRPEPILDRANHTLTVRIPWTFDLDQPADGFTLVRANAFSTQPYPTGWHDEVEIPENTTLERPVPVGEPTPDPPAEGETSNRPPTSASDSGGPGNGTGTRSGPSQEAPAPWGLAILAVVAVTVARRRR